MSQHMLYPAFIGVSRTRAKTILKYRNVNYGFYLYSAITPPPDAPNANVEGQIAQEHF